MSPDTDLLAPLRRYWGYDSFRLRQEQIVRSLIEGHDAAVVMPTGGGKSLCYQLPALVLGRTVVVISPLIALMQDQAAQLAQMGVPAAVLNSALAPQEQSAVIRRAQQGHYRLLYLSPERLARTDTIDWLRRVPVAFFAIDEAHCISEWGHEFRPEYRQLSRLREQFPDLPIAAFTASATRRVRHDILEQLQLRDPHKFILSFHRANLRYVARECTAHTQERLLVEALGTYEGSNVIVYAPTIARVEETVDLLAERGIPAIPYHGKMETDLRRRNQERWMSDEVRVLVGTIAFGLGINKAAVRAVIHLALPKSIEQYYQEAGRAGRDGEPADCALLWQKKDIGLLVHFIDQLGDPAERERAWQRYHDIRRYGESTHCRHRQICLHFGETPKWPSCGNCDVCGSAPEWLSTRYEEEKPRRRKKEKTEPAPVVREAASPSPPPPRAASPMPVAAGSAAAQVDPELRKYLQEWRRKMAERQGVPAFVVLHDTSLDDLCRRRPSTLAELLRVYGFGERKAELYGEQIFAALEAFRNGARVSAPARPTSATPAEETIRLVSEGRSLEEIAQLRNRQLNTVVSMAADLVEKGRLEFQPQWVAPEKQARIEAAVERHGTETLKRIKDALPAEISYEEIRLVVARLRGSRK